MWLLVLLVCYNAIATRAAQGLIPTKLDHSYQIPFTINSYLTCICAQENSLVKNAVSTELIDPKSPVLIGTESMMKYIGILHVLIKEVQVYTDLVS